MNFIKFESRDLDFYKNHLTSLRAPGDYLELYKVQNFIKFSTQYRPTSTGHPGSTATRSRYIHSRRTERPLPMSASTEGL